MKWRPSKMNLPAIAEEINRLAFWVDGSGALMSIGQGKGLPPEIAGMPNIKMAIEEISQIRNQRPLNLMINKLPAATGAPKHRDFIPPTTYQGGNPTVERWHLPIVTDDKCFWWDELNGEIFMESKYWWGPVPYWVLHTIYNHGQTERVHLIVDLDSPIPVGKYNDR